MRIFERTLNRRKFFLLLPIILFGIFLSLLLVSRSQSYVYYERVEFKCGEAELHANLYHPTNNIDFQGNKHPLVIYIHGFSGQKDIDLRVPLELTKRGFFVASVDMPGHGESANSDLLDTDGDGEFVATQMCSKLLDKIESLDVYPQIDEDQIGILGYSYGGYVALMNGLYDDRFRVTIAWAGVADVTVPYKGVDISDRKKDLLHENNPVEVMNNGSKQPENLLLIVHKEDFWYKYNKRLHGATNCEIEKLDYPVNGVQEAHSLSHNSVMIKTIRWFEKEFFESESKNGPIQLTYQYDWLLLLLTLLTSYLTIFSLMIYASKFILKLKASKAIKSSYRRKIASESNLTPASKKKKQIAVLSLSIPIFVSLWFLGGLLFGWWASIFASAMIILIYLLFFRRILRKDEPIEDKKLTLIEKIKSEDSKKSIVYSIFCASLFLAFYFIFALIYPFWLLYPLTFLAFVISLIYIPIYLSMEIFYRKIIYPSLDFIKSKKTRTYTITLITLFVQLFLLIYTMIFMGMPVLLAASFFFMFVSLMNGIIYHKTDNLGAGFLNSLIIMSVFYGATWSFLLNLLAIIS